MDRELRELHRGAREERKRMLSDLGPDPHDVPGHGRPGGIDDPVPDAEYGDVQGGPDRPEEPPEAEEDSLAALIEDHAFDLRAMMGQSNRYNETKTDLWGARAIRHLTALEGDRPAANAPDWKHEAYEHERATALASIANDLIQAVEHSDVLNGEERGKLQVAKHTTGEAVADHYHVAHGIRRENREDDHA